MVQSTSTWAQALLVARSVYKIHCLCVARFAGQWTDATRTGLVALVVAVALPNLASPALAQASSLLDPSTTQINARGSHRCELTIAGGVRCWGNNSRGQLGNNRTTSSSTPVAVNGLASGVASISVGSAHTCALISAGGVKCWGSNAYGQLGNAGATYSSTPVAVTGMAASVVAISAGDSHTCGLSRAGAVQCWGSNSYGQLGDGSTTNSSTPVAVTDLASGVVAISAGDSHTCALNRTGRVQCWGKDGSGQPGSGGTTNRPTPAATGVASGVVAIGAGKHHACPLTSAGEVQCWERDDNGQASFTAAVSYPVNRTITAHYSVDSDTASSSVSVNEAVDAVAVPTLLRWMLLLLSLLLGAAVVWKATVRGQRQR